ncbi:hypothetical protein Rhe02_55620 [Rhizocola hellebori]|uniref:Uncharacterized protein n=1 Tax=Rhizocola hellebori TaxID=1392758 RepID=A0A8J3VID8_9ACTN|nr:hypothetical protein [Rhizocola hellebori]GIH07495.1 hypothetical protein Rhe02_55620 [Rhizocola hellebori]
MSEKELIAVTENVRVLGSATFAINSATTTNGDFGTPDDISLEALAAAGTYKPGDRVLVVFSAPRTAGAGSDAISFSVQDAPDNAGSIGTPATAETDGTLTGGSGHQTAVAAVKVKAGRPWLRFRATRAGTTDTHQVSITVLAVGRAA